MECIRSYISQRFGCYIFNYISYPILIFYILLFYYVFAVGPNITAEKKKAKNIVYSNIFLGIFIGILVLLILIFKCDSFLLIMNVDVSVFRIFTIYSLFNIFYSYVLKLVLEKLYYEKENNIRPTLHSGIEKTLRTLCSFIHNPFCTYIGQVVEMIYNYFYTKIVSRGISEIR